MYATVLICVLAGIASLAVDYGRARLAKTQLRNAVDAASLAGCSGLAVSPAEARTRAKNIAQLNTVDGRPLALLDSDIEMGTWNGTTRLFTLLTGSNESKATALRITGRLTNARGTPVRLLFLPVIGGGNYCEVQASAVGGSSASAFDIVVAQDVTGSFSEELSDAKTGDQSLLDSIQSSGGQSGFGLVAFTGWGKTIAPLQKVSGNYTVLTNAITSLKVGGSKGMPISSGTDIASGIEQAIAVFNAYSSPSSNGKAMVIVSDGQPNQDSDGKHPTLSDSKLLTLAQQDANAAWAQNIHIYVVFFDRDNDAQAAANLATLKRGIGDFVRVSDPHELPTALQSIVRKLSGRLVK